MIKFEVGKKEKHQLRFNYDPIWGKVTIEVDGVVIIQERKMTIGYYPFEFEVGDNEKHTVKIDLNNPLGFAFNGSVVYVHVDGKTIRQEKILNNRMSQVFVIIFIITIALLVGVSIN